MADTESAASLLDMPKLGASNNAQYLTPQMAQQLANIAYAPEEQGGIQQQLQQAIALRNGTQTPQRHSPLAAAFDGVGNIAKQMQSFQQENRLRGQQADLLAGQKTAFGDYLKQLAQAQALRGGQTQPAPQQDPGYPSMDLSQT